MSRILSVIVVLTAVLVSANVLAADRNMYASLKIGAFFPNGDEEGLKDFYTGLNLEAGLGVRLHPNFAAEGGIGYYHTEYDDDYGHWLDVIPVTLTAKAIYPVKEYEIYVGGGLGYYSATIKYEHQVYGWSHRYIYEDSASAIGIHLLGGVLFNITEKFAMLLEEKWFSAKPDFVDFGERQLGGTTTVIGFRVGF